MSKGPLPVGNGRAGAGPARPGSADRPSPTVRQPGTSGTAPECLIQRCGCFWSGRASCGRAPLRASSITPFPRGCARTEPIASRPLGFTWGPPIGDHVDAISYPDQRSHNAWCRQGRVYAAVTVARTGSWNTLSAVFGYLRTQTTPPGNSRSGGGRSVSSCGGSADSSSH